MSDWLWSWRRWQDRPRIEALAERLLQFALPPHTPYQYDPALSFLQPPGRPLGQAVRVTLFLPELPLAVDLLGPEADPRFDRVWLFLGRPAWERVQADLAWKRRQLERYRCPYLVLTPNDPVDLTFLAERVRLLAGRALAP